MPGHQADEQAARDAVVAAFEQTPAMVIAVEGPCHVLRALNDHARRFFVGLVEGVPVAESMTELGGQQVLERYDEVFQSGEPYAANEWRVEIEGPDGPITTYFDYRLFPWRHRDGSVRGVVGYGNDITESVERRKRLEDEGDGLRQAQVEASRLVITLQDALLPTEVPVLPGVDIDARYLLAAEGATAGGDWFDAIRRPDGRVALVVGDVVGHGVVASAVMAQLRSVLHERLAAGADLLEAMSALDRHSARVREARAATVCVVDLEPRSGGMVVCTAGHPPPLVVDARGGSRFLEPTGGGPLGVGGDVAIATDRLDPGELVLIYSDGLVERPGRTPVQNTLDLAQVASDIMSGRARVGGPSQRLSERMCDGTMELLTRITGYADDITLVAAQRIPAPAQLDLHLAAEETSIATARRGLTHWLDGLGVGILDQMALHHSTGEVVANAVEHAYVDGDASPELEVHAELGSDGRAVVRVSDHGRWRPAVVDAGVRGRGLPLAAGLCDSLAVDRGDDGTTVTIHHAMTRPARMLSGITVAEPPSPIQDRYEEEIVQGRLTVRGPVDSVTAERLRSAVRRLLRGGVVPGVADLSEVTVLGSAGVQVLHEAQAGAPEQLRLVAPMGTAAQHVLDLVQLPYSTELDDRMP